MKKLTDKIEAFLELGGVRREITLLAISALALALSLLRWPKLPFDAAWVAILLCGVPILLEAFVGLVTRFDIKADVLVSLALIASVCIGEIFAAGEVAFIMQLGALLEDLTVRRARAGIERLVCLTPQTARVLRDGTEAIVPAQEVAVGDRVHVLPGETVPVDGLIVSGHTSVNQAVMTGESMPVDKAVGDEVFSGTVNQFGAFELRATKVGEDSSIQRMIRLVQSADADKAKIVRLADRWATWIVVIALSAALLTWLFTGLIIRAVTILVVFCPCALVLATPTAIMAAIGNATKHGFLVREGDAMERLAGVKVVAFDKTGTLTYGTPTVAAAQSVSDLSDAEVYALAAAVEARSEHPLGKAVVQCFDGIVRGVEDFRMFPGMGVSAMVDGVRILAGNEKLLRGNGVDMPNVDAAETWREQGCTIIYIATDKRLVGFIALSDSVREDARKVIEDISTLNVSPMLLTGDSEAAARSIAGQLGIENVRAGCLPEDKLCQIDVLQQFGGAVCMIGDGVNDAPALKRAHVGIAMGGIGSDIAIDAADIALIDDDICELPHLLALSRHMMRTIRMNLTFSMTLNFAAIALAITGALDPVVGALVHNAGSVFVILHSALLLKWRRRV